MSEHFSIFGCRLISSFPFANRLARCDSLDEANPLGNLTFDSSLEPPAHLAENGLDGAYRRPAFSSPLRTPRGDALSSLYRLPDFDIMRFTELTDFYLTDTSIHGQLIHPQAQHLLEIHLLGPVIAFWLERRGLPVLHASAVEIDGGAVGFLASNGGGKTTLAAACLQDGHPLLTDDLLPLYCQPGGEILGLPGYPQLRLWPRQTEAFLGSAEGLQRVHPDFEKLRVPVRFSGPLSTESSEGSSMLGEFRNLPSPLRRLYLPDRRLHGEGGDEVKIRPLSPRDTIVELFRFSFLQPLVDGLGWQPRRLDTFGDMAVRVPIARLSYPSGLEHLPRIREAIVADVRKG